MGVGLATWGDGRRGERKGRMEGWEEGMIEGKRDEFIDLAGFAGEEERAGDFEVAGGGEMGDGRW